jgi:hypothetical protein
MAVDNFAGPKLPPKQLKRKRPPPLLAGHEDDGASAALPEASAPTRAELPRRRRPPPLLADHEDDSGAAALREGSSPVAITKLHKRKGPLAMALDPLAMALDPEDDVDLTPTGGTYKRRPRETYEEIHARAVSRAGSVITPLSEGPSPSHDDPAVISLLEQATEALQSQQDGRGEPLIFNTKANPNDALPSEKLKKQFIAERKVFLHATGEGKFASYFLIDARAEPPVTIAVIKPLYVQSAVLEKDAEGSFNYPGIDVGDVTQREEIAYRLSGEFGVSPTTLINLPMRGVATLCSIQKFIPGLEITGRSIDPSAKMAEKISSGRISPDEAQKMAIAHLITGQLDGNRGNFGFIEGEDTDKIGVFDFGVCLPARCQTPPRALIWLSWETMRQPISAELARQLEESSWESKSETLLSGREPNEELVKTACAYHEITKMCLLAGMTPYDVACLTIDEPFKLFADQPPSVIAHCFELAEKGPGLFTENYRKQISFIISCHQKAREYTGTIPPGTTTPFFKHSTTWDRKVAIFNDAVTSSLLHATKPGSPSTLQTLSTEAFEAQFKTLIAPHIGGYKHASYH